MEIKDGFKLAIGGALGCGCLFMLWWLIVGIGAGVIASLVH